METVKTGVCDTSRRVENHAAGRLCDTGRHDPVSSLTISRSYESAMIAHSSKPAEKSRRGPGPTPSS